MVQVMGRPATVPTVSPASTRSPMARVGWKIHGGRIALVGWPHGLTTLNQTRLQQKEVDILTCRNSCAKFPEAIKLIEEDVLPIKKMITKIVSLDETADTIRDMMEHPGNYLKAIVRI